MINLDSLERLQEKLKSKLDAESYHIVEYEVGNAGVEHAELMAMAMKMVREEKVEPLEAENAKLRELARQMHTCLTRPKVYAGASRPYLIATECPYFTQGVCDYNSCGFERRMRELGVEVDG